MNNTEEPGFPREEMPVPQPLPQASAPPEDAPEPQNAHLVLLPDP